MSRSAVKKLFGDLSGGFNSEGNVLSYPDNAAIDLLNVDIAKNGTVGRRLGLDFDSSTKLSFANTTPLINTAVSSFLWESVNNDPALDFVVVQVGNLLHFFDANADGDLIDNVVGSPLSLIPAFATTTNIEGLYRSRLEYTSGFGKLFIANKYLQPTYISYTAGSFVVSTFDIKVRDFEVWKESEYVGAYSSAGEVFQNTMSPYHQYNLRNAGWPGTTAGETQVTCSSADNPSTGTGLQKPAAYTYTITGNFPTIGIPFHANQAGGGDTISKQTAYSPWKVTNDYYGTSLAPRGKIIYSIFNRTRAGYGDLGALSAPAYPWGSLSASETFTTDIRPSAIAFYSGRVWTTGPEGTELSNNIYFTQQLNDSLSNLNKCYQEADPTAEDINELVATDGGVVSIRDIGKIYHMTVVGVSLIVIAENGMWAISGPDGTSSFKANDFSVSKISDVEVLGRDTIVKHRNTILFPSKDAVYAAIRDNATGTISVSDISTPTIKTFYGDLTTSQKSAMRGVYDSNTNKVCWLYASSTPYMFDSMLCFDIDLQSFVKHKFSMPSGYIISDLFSTTTPSTYTETHDVLVNGVPVEVNGEQVVVRINGALKVRPSIKFFTSVDDPSNIRKFSFASIKRRDFKDFTNYYASYVQTGFDSLGDIMNNAKKAPLMYFHFNRTEDGFSINPADPDMVELILNNQSSCLVSYKWDWGDLPYNNQFQAYRLSNIYNPSSSSDTFEYDRSVVSTKNRIRGKGMSLGLRLDSEDGKDFQLLGYGILYTQDDRV